MSQAGVRRATKRRTVSAPDDDDSMSVRVDNAEGRGYGEGMKTTNGFAADLREMMAAWATIEAAARREFPNASADELYQICRGAMDHALGLSGAQEAGL